MDNNIPKISGWLRFAAGGALIAMLPMTIGLFFGFSALIDLTSESMFNLLIVNQLLGCIMWLIGLGICGSKCRKLGILPIGFWICFTSVLIGMILELIMLSDGHVYYRFMYRDVADSIGGFSVLFTLFVNIPLIVGTSILGARLKTIKKARTGYCLIASAPFLIIILSAALLGGYRYSSDAWNIFILILSIYMLVSVIICLSGWFKAANEVAAIQQELEDNMEYEVQADYVEQTPSAQQYQQPYPQSPAYQQTPQPQLPVTPEQKRMLLGMSDQELINIVHNPTLYASQAFVEEARNTFSKRRAWETIKDYSDAQLLELVHTDNDNVSAETRDAASMELLTRNNAELINEVSALSTEELKGIVSNQQNYFDGYVQLAIAILNERTNTATHPTSVPPAFNPGS